MKTRLPSRPLLLAVAFAFGACRSSDAPAPVAATHPTAPSLAAPAVDAATPATFAGLHNVVTYAPGLVCGGVPEGEHGLATLAAMGIKTIVSVDGAEPEAETATKLGMRYIHLPIPYSGITAERDRELAQAVANAEGPIYVHCHHGKHRSAAALGSALVLCGKLTPEQAMTRMKVSGTGDNYQGLWQAVREAKPLPAAALQADVTKFPAVAKVRGTVATMSEIDAVFDNVTAAQKAGWQVPADHPDLVPGKETKRLASLFSQLHGEAECAGKPAAFHEQLARAIAQSKALDDAVAKADAAAATTQHGLLQKGCKECHKAFRDN